MEKSCPTTSVLLRYIRGESLEKSTDSIESHIADCLNCQAKLELLADESDSMMQLVAEAVLAPSVHGARLPSELQAQSLNPGLTSHSYSSDHLRKVMNDWAGMIRDYQILERIGRGGMGTVYRALHVRLNKLVALKILKSDRMDSAEAVARFKREMILLAKLEHPQIVRAHDAGDQDGLHYFVMEFVTGIDLSQLVQRLGPLPVLDACQIVRLAASALQFAHDHKVIHRDVKPSNLMMTTEGNVKLLDWGLAQIFDLKVEDPISRTNQALGTLAYMAPEQLNGSPAITIQSDIYSLGVTFHELLTGNRPFERAGFPKLISNIRSVRPDIDSSLHELLKDMIATIPSERPSSMSQVISRLDVFPVADLSNLIAKYYRWDNRNSPNSPTDPVRLETKVSNIETQIGSETMATRLVAHSTRSPRNLRVWILPSLILFLLGSLISGMAILFGLIMFLPTLIEWNARPHVKSPTAIVVPTGRVLVTAMEDSMQSQLLEEGHVLLENRKTGDRYNVSKGLTVLPVGSYKVHIDAPVDFQSDDTPFDVYSTATSRLTLQTNLAREFQYPDLPSQKGAFGTYHGKIRLAGWSEEEAITFNLRLEILEVNSERNVPETKWLKIATDNENFGYEEIAYLRIDSRAWENDDHLQVIEGWVEARSSSIERFMRDRFAGSSTPNLVVPFDPRKDWLSEIAASSLPKRRLSVHDFILLFFGDESTTAAALPIRTLRPNLSASGRNEWLESFTSKQGTVACYVVSSRTKGEATTQDGWSMRRRRSDARNPFGFEMLEVKFPSLMEANCVLMKGNTNDVENGWGERQKELRKQVIDPASLRPKGVLSENKEVPPASRGSIEPKEWWQHEFAAPPSIKENNQFDLANLPARPEYVTWTGMITVGENRQKIDATARMLGSEFQQGREFRWIEIEATSRASNEEHWEGARLLVDAEKYEQSNEFVFQSGSVAFDSKTNVFELPTDGNLDSLVDLRLQLQGETTFDRIGVADVLSMLFDARLKPKSSLAELRPVFASVLRGEDRSRSDEVKRTLKNGQQLEGILWESPKKNNERESSAAGLKAKFFRNSTIPFGIVSVSLTVQSKLEIGLPYIDIGLEITSKRGPLPSDFSQSLFGTKSELETLKRDNIVQLQSKERKNWRVWTWSHQKKKYKAWGEFGGTINRGPLTYVLLRDPNGNEIQVAINQLSDEDRAIATRGRFWASVPAGERRVLVDVDEKKKTITVRQLADKNKPEVILPPLDYTNMVLEDREWLSRFLKSQKANFDATKNIQDWQSFAKFIR